MTELWWNHDNTAHTVLPVQKFLVRNRTPVLPQPPYRPDLYPAYSCVHNWRWIWRDIQMDE